MTNHGKIMKIVIAIDSLKGSLTSIEAGNAIKKGILNAVDAEVIVKPLADGGEGTTVAIVEGLGGELITRKVMGPMGKPVVATYGYLKEKNMAVIEMAEAAGITLIKSKKKNPLLATTYGVGELIKDAIQKGCREFIIGIGGSATNDGGVGMLSALGYQFLNSSGACVELGGHSLKDIVSIDDTNRIKELDECFFKVACDVTNPLYGPNGCTYIYGPQKGVTEDIKDFLDKGMRNYAAVTSSYLMKNFADSPGSGAAGGLGYAFISFLNSKLISGIDLILETINFEQTIIDADYIVTGEGKLDAQTAMGKAPIGVAKLAKKHGAIVLAFAGSVANEASPCNDAGIDSFFSILTQVVTLKEAMSKERALQNLSLTAEQVFRLINATNQKLTS